jgi:hypothetical protein
MATSKKFFNDHLVLALVSVNVFLAIACCLFILLRLSTGHGLATIQYRETVGINQYKTGSIVDLVALAVFAIVTLISNIALSLGIYKINRQLAIVILTLGILLLVLTAIVSNALLVFR